MSRLTDRRYMIYVLLLGRKTKSTNQPSSYIHNVRSQIAVETIRLPQNQPKYDSNFSGMTKIIHIDRCILRTKTSVKAILFS